MSYTPRVDAVADKFHGGDKIDWVKADFARQLERELAASNAKIAENETVLIRIAQILPTYEQCRHEATLAITKENNARQ